MKKILTLLLALCLMATMLCVPAFAAEDYVISLSGLKKDGTLEAIGYESSFETGWNAAVGYALNHDWMDSKGYSRIVVDLHADWNANTAGEFGDSDGEGFRFSTIEVPMNTKITINMNGHTINRGLKVNEYDGEVIYVNDGADLIINGGTSKDPVVRGDSADGVFGTITGGNSDNGAGGIHVCTGASLELKNVKVIGNIADYDDGAGIAAYNATVVIKGGSINNNILDTRQGSIFCYGGGLYAEGSRVTIENVEFKNNQTKDYWSDGVAVYVEECDITVDQCIFDGNGVGDEGEEIVIYHGISVVYANDSNITIKKTTFINNSSRDRSNLCDPSLISLDTDTTLEMDECVFKNNAAKFLFDMDGVGRRTNNFYIKNSQFVDNKSAVMEEDFFASGCFEKCTFNNNEYPASFIYDFRPISYLIFRDCSMGDTSYDDFRLPNIEFQDAEGNKLGGSIFGEGSMSVLISLAALAVSVACIGVVFASKKEKGEIAE